MSTCFVIQPFDSDKFDKRFDSIFEPAAKQAGMKAYRVDRDNAATVLIQAIEENIRRSSVCLADITTDNPNVWYELGYALALNRPVVMVCGQERFVKDAKFPFDIQHRSILSYKTDSPQDFEEFKTKLTEKLRVTFEKSAVIDQMESGTLADIEGLTPPELTVLAMIANSASDDSSPTALWGVCNDSEKAGLTSIGFNLGLRRLKAKGFVSTCQVNDGQSYEGYEALKLEPRAWDWIENNESKFVIHVPQKKPPISFADMDDDIPF